eukprot:11218307-Lingulodinium_polyedra.AAC.1
MKQLSAFALPRVCSICSVTRWKRGSLGATRGQGDEEGFSAPGFPAGDVVHEHAVRGALPHEACPGKVGVP